MPPYPVIRRLPRYLSLVTELKDQQAEWVSSVDLSKALGLTTSTIRQDLSHLDLEGVSKRGYRRDELETALKTVLQTERVHRVAIVGAGYLGTALALHGGLQRYGFEVCALFDANSELVGNKVGNLSIHSMDSLARLVESMNIDMAIIAVPPTAAQEVANLLVKAGITGLMNLAYCVLQVPDDVFLVDVRILSSLQELAYLMSGHGNEHPKGVRR